MKIDNEFNQAFKGKTCEFEYQGRKCKSTEIVGIARGRFLCRVHFKTITKDNTRLIRKGQDIPKDLIFTKVLPSADTWSRPIQLNKMGGKNGN